MQIKHFSKKKLLVSLLFAFILLTLSLFAKESIGRSISVSILVLFFYLFYLFSEKISFAFISFLLLSLPLNITYQLPIEFSKTLVNNIHVNYLVPTLSIIDLGVFLFITVLLIENRLQFKTIFQKYKLPLFLFSLILLLQNIFFRDLLVSLNSARFLTYIFTFLILIEEFRRKRIETKEVNLFSILLFLTTAGQAIVGYLQFNKGVSLGINFLGESQVAAGLLGSSFVSLSGTEILRSYGTFPHPNILAGFFLFSFFLSLYFVKNIQKKYSFVSFLTMLISVIFIIPTFSRVTILLLFFSILILSFTFFIRKKRLLSFTPILLVERFLSLIKGADSGAIDRRNLIKVFPSIFKENIFQGMGFGRYVLFMGDKAPVTKGGLFLLQPVHNVFLLLLSELGIFGFLAFFFLISKIFKESIKSLTIFSVLILSSILVIGMFDHYLVSLPQGLGMLWGFVGLAILFSNKLKQDKEDIN